MANEGIEIKLKGRFRNLHKDVSGNSKGQNIRINEEVVQDKRFHNSAHRGGKTGILRRQTEF